MTSDAVAAAEDEVVELASELIRIDTTNTGNPDTVTGEREAAEYVAAKLSEVGFEIEMVESGAPRRDNVFCRLPGADPIRLHQLYRRLDLSMCFEPTDQAVYVTARPRVDSPRVRGGT